MKNFGKSTQKNLIILGAAGIIVGASLWAFFHFTKSPVFSQIQLYEVKKGSIETELSEEVVLQPTAEVDLSFENPGKIKTLLVAVGDRVKKGQLLAEEADADYRAALRGALAKQEAAEASLKQSQEEVSIQKAKLQALKNAKAKKYDIKAQKKTKDKAEAGVEAQEALLEVAQSAVDEANLQLAKTRLIAPLEGVITAKKAEVGAVVAPGSPILSLSTADNLEAHAFVSELEVKKIVVGNEAQIIFSSTDGNSIEIRATIKNIYPAGTIQNGVSSYEVIFELAQQNSDLKSGMTGTAKIKLSKQTGVIYIPQSSLFSEAGKKYVMVFSQTSGFPEKKEVQVGSSGADGTVEILSGLSEGDKVIKF